MEYLKGGTLKSFIKEKEANGDKISDFEASQIMKGILKAVEFIHSKGIVH